MKKSFLFLVCTALVLTGCASFSISKESFLSQLKENQYVERAHNASSVGTGYDSNGIEKIKCIDKNGKEVWLSGGKNVNFKITKASGESVTMYFDTVYFKNDTIFGLKSRILGGKRMIPVSEIATVAINAEEAETKPVK
jgi:hypothetical protein